MVSLSNSPFKIFQMVLASRVIKHYKGLARIPSAELEEDYDDKPLPPVPPHQAPGAVLGARYGHGRGGGGGGSVRSDVSKNGGVRFGPIETKEVPRTLRKDLSLEQYAPTPPRKKKGLLSRGGGGGGRRQGSAASFERDYEISPKYAHAQQQQQPQQPAAVNHTYMPSPSSGRRRSDERRQVDAMSDEMIERQF